MKKFELSNFKKDSSKVFSGRSEGQTLREKLRLDEFDKSEEKVSLIFPDDTISVNSSYFLGAFGPSIRTLGEIEFRNKFEFRYPEHLKRNIEDGIKRALKSSNPLGN